MTTADNALVTVEQPKAIVAIKAALDSRIDDIAAVLPDNMNPQRFVRTAILAVSKNPDLMACSQASLVRSIVEAAEVGLEPTGSLSRAWLAPFKEKGKDKPEAKLMIGYQGLADLMRDTGRIRQVWAEVVYEGDEFEYELGMSPVLRHVPKHTTEDPSKVTFVYSCARFADGEVQFHVMSRQQVEVIRARAFSRNSPAWTGSWPAMARKTALRQLANYVPLSTKAQGAIERDDEREFSTPSETGAASTRGAELRDKIKARLPGQPPESAPGAPDRPDKPEVDPNATSESSADQHTETGGVDEADGDGEVEAEAHEVCGVVDEKLDCGPCTDAPHEKGEHHDGRGQTWTSLKGGPK